MNAFFKDIYREINNTKGRFFSILLITMLGAASVVGIQATAIDMRNGADSHYKEHALYDIEIKSTVGFNDDDRVALMSTYGVSDVMLTYSFDVFTEFDDSAFTVRTHALPDKMNTIDLIEGRLPETKDECVIEADLSKRGDFKIGGTITFMRDDMDTYHDALAEDSFTIVGIVSSPLYVSSADRGHTTLGDGMLEYYVYLHASAYLTERFTDAYLNIGDLTEMNNLSQEYFDAAKERLEDIKVTGSERVKKMQDEIDELRAELDRTRSEYNDSLEQFNGTLEEMNIPADNLPPALAEAKSELDNAKLELDKAEEELNSLPVPEWFYFTREDGPAYTSYYQDTLRLEKIGYVFPLVFYLVAVMVSLTTMSRMVEEHRTQIGVYKALGYRPFKTMTKYLFYAFAASFSGGAAGVATGSVVFPLIITDAYAHMYEMPPIETPIPAVIGLIAVLAAVGSVLFVTLGTCINSMTDMPAQLMRPKAPRAGKRVLIERIPFIWNNLRFIGKVTARNIFRYKRRFLMTLAGIAGCSALLLTAFGLRDSISGVADLQYGEIVQYDVRAYLKETDNAKLHTITDSVPDSVSLFIREESVDAAGSKGELSASLIVPETPGELKEYLNLTSAVTETALSFTENDVFITEKLARVLGVSAGDEFTVTANSGKQYKLTATAIVKNYVMHYIYIPPSLYSELFAEETQYNSVLTLVNDGADENKTAAAFLTDNNVRAVTVTSELWARLSVSTDAIGIVTVVLIILACALALVVLFNLTNINITERIRELATIKVLGFYNSELAMYVYRENAAVTFLGILFGLIGGLLLHGYVLTSVEIDLLMFPHIINLPSYIYAIVLSAVFAVFVNLVMLIRLARINMVESLKSTE